MRNLLLTARKSILSEKIRFFVLRCLSKNYSYSNKMEKQQGFQFPKVPNTEKGFTVSFDINNFEPKEVAQFYHTYGFVVFDNIVTEEQAEKTIDELWLDVQYKCGKDHNRHDPKTWTFKGYKGNYGFVNFDPIFTKQVCLNRQNPLVYKAFKSLYELSSGYQVNEPLLACFDRGSAMRPAGINKDWKTKDIYHFDINPWWWTKVVHSEQKNWRRWDDYNPQKFIKWKGEGNYVPNRGYTKLAGVLALSDTNEISGGFQCVAGFHRVIKEWCQKTPFRTQIQQDKNLMNNMQKIFMRKGSMMVFTRELPHNIYYNLSDKFRFAQYLRMSPQSALMLNEQEVLRRKECIKYCLPKDLPVDDPISKEVYMLE